MTKRSIFKRIADFFKRSPEAKLEKEKQKLTKISEKLGRQQTKVSRKLNEKQQKVERLEIQVESKQKEPPVKEGNDEIGEIKENVELPPGIEPLGEEETIYDFRKEKKSNRRSLNERTNEDWKEYKQSHTLYETCYLIIGTQEPTANPSNPNYKPNFHPYALDTYKMDNNDDMEYLSYYQRSSKYPVYYEYRCPTYSSFPVSREESYRILQEEEP